MSTTSEEPSSDSVNHNRVLIVEDELIARTILEKQLKSWGYKVITAESGEQGMKLIEQDDCPSLMLLDWELPGVDGLELCRLVRKIKDENTYLMMVTGKTDQEYITEALDAGADDYIFKPYHKRLLRSRLLAAERKMLFTIEATVQKNFLKMHADQMEELAKARAKQLVHSDRLATLGTMSAGVAHEINNPTTFISGNAQLLEKFWEELCPIIDRQEVEVSAESNRIQFIKEEMPKLLEGISEGVARIHKIVKGLKRYSHQTEIERSDVSLEGIIDGALEITKSHYKGVVSVEKNIGRDVSTVHADSVQIEQVLINLIVNACHALEGRSEPRIDIRAKSLGRSVVLEIEDNGTGISEDILEKIWAPFFTTKEVGKGTGLGLHLCRDIIRDHDGDITAENIEGSGARFTIILSKGAH